jgi:adenylate cyclase
MVVGIDPSALCDWAVGLVALATERPLPRIGLHAGSVLYRDGDYYGRAVNLASRLCDKAAPGECLATLEIAKRAPDLVVAEPVGAVDVPGFARAVDVARLAFAPQALPTA